ncbi:Detected protein of confused Function [Hibiscus syriacus]|uniref:Detected protein of confused Function n=1 Tax=Hibiscus syriacus TaxID=106335 RepID=A0A6A2WFZ4_HIBSY|nr:receptor-like protein kinase HSL1 [Hibiscus syriacus]KAE8656591.1 Detected protein of confused Function [Hibiscus syriacus]
MSQLCLYFVFLLFISISLKVTSQDINAERDVLLDLKRQLGNPPSIQSWTSSSSPCDWPEINCTANSVTEVHLADKNITVPIPPTICGLKNLTLLDLAYNYIPGEFPPLYNCSKLQTLDLSQNYFVGSIPDQIDRLSTLVYLDVGANNFSGNIPPSIGRLSNLQTLYMYQNLFNGTFPKEIGNLSNLEVLGMAYNEFSPVRIPQGFGQLRKLRYLWMTRTNLIGQIPESFNNLSSLQHLDLSGNNLEGPIPGRLFSLNLTHVYLYHNKLSGEIPRPVEALNLVEIDLSMNTLTGSIPEEFGKLQYLDFLNLFSNRLTGGLPASIGFLPALRDFRVFRNNLTGVLPPEFGLHSKLEGFEVSQNQFSGQLPENLCAGGVLQGVVAHTNNLSGEVPKSLGNCRTLRTFQLHNNRFSGEIPQGLWTTFNLSTLMLSNNSFSGELPSELALNMSRVEISDNKFSGEIPATVASWTNLVVFQASNNLFSGRIPKEITALSSLTTLLLNGNDFSGELPSEIISWRQLTTLDLSNNKLSGEIPAAVGSLPNLLNLDLSENQFSGEIPLGIGNLRLTSLNLSSNKLVGRIPSQFDNLAYENSFLNNADLCADDPILRLSDCNSELHESKGLSSRHISIILPFVILFSLAILVLSFFIVQDYRRKKRRQYLATWKLTSFQRLDFTEGKILSGLTNDNLIGSGGSGKVYRIIINPSNEYVAVKKIWNTKKLDYKLEKEFLAEVEILSSIRHSNIVKLLCCISSEDSKLLVYEYMENHSLDRWLHRNKKSSVSGSGSVYQTVLDWPTRLRIAVGAAQGLCYMHHECPTPIIHRDVKSSNILLDSEFKAKIADFGLAKMLTRHAGSHTMSVVAGSFGYFAPEYAYTTKVNAKVDVYSFGVVLLELVTGREANNIDQNMNLVEWAWHHFSEDKPITEILDPELRESSYLEDMIMVYKIGIMCTRASPSTRPSMKEVLHALRSCCPEDGQGAKKKITDIDMAPLLGSVTGTYLSSYKNSKKGFEEDDSVIFDV